MTIPNKGSVELLLCNAMLLQDGTAQGKLGRIIGILADLNRHYGIGHAHISHERCHLIGLHYIIRHSVACNKRRGDTNSYICRSLSHLFPNGRCFV